ncbi:MAG: transposase [Cryomorphaceae bacterium]
MNEYIVMPNHLHGIVIIDKPTGAEDVTHVGNTGNCTISPEPGGITGHHNPMLGGNLGRIIRWFKGRTTFESRKINRHFQWQTRYYDHIIRNNRSFRSIARYIGKNPEKWE